MDANKTNLLISISLSLPGTSVRKSGSANVITNGRGGGGGANGTGQNGSRMSAASKNQLDPSPHELPVKDTDRAIDVASAEREYAYKNSANTITIIFSHRHSNKTKRVSMQDCRSVQESFPSVQKILSI